MPVSVRHPKAVVLHQQYPSQFHPAHSYPCCFLPLLYCLLPAVHYFHNHQACQLPVQILLLILQFFFSYFLSPVNNFSISTYQKLNCIFSIRNSQQERKNHSCCEIGYHFLLFTTLCISYLPKESIAAFV